MDRRYLVFKPYVHNAPTYGNHRAEFRGSGHSVPVAGKTLDPSRQQPCREFFYSWPNRSLAPIFKGDEPGGVHILLEHHFHLRTEVLPENYCVDFLVMFNAQPVKIG